nr:response regulator transcription factor [Bacteroidota bacterium]
MNPITTIIIDDEPSAIENLEILLAEFEYVKIEKTFTSADPALDFLLENKVDVIFLDVEMPGKTGFDFLHELEKYPEIPCIIFTTGFESYAIEALRHTAFDFLLKPVSKDELQNALRRLKLKCSHEEFRKNTQGLFQKIAPPQKIVFSHYRGFVAYYPNEILYFEADRNYAYIHFTNGKKQIVSMQLGQIENAIPSSHFFRINRSIIINLEYFTHADQKEKKCYLEADSKEFSFQIKVSRIKELMRVMVGR